MKLCPRFEPVLLLLTGIFLLGSAAAFLWSGSSEDMWRVTSQRAADVSTAEQERKANWPDSLRNGEVLDLNTASKSDLIRLPGIGEVRAEAILERRAECGGFSDVEELAQIDGIGQATLEKIRPYIRISAQEETLVP